MPSKNPPTTFRFDPTSKAALQLIADKEGRSMANMLEWLIRKHCERESLGWPPAGLATPTRGRAASLAPAKASAGAGAKKAREVASKKN